MNVPLPSHHGHTTVWGSPPRLEVTLPAPWHGVHDARSGSGLAVPPSASPVSASGGVIAAEPYLPRPPALATGYQLPATHPPLLPVQVRLILPLWST